MECDNIGPFCKQIGLLINNVTEIKPLINCHILNGVVLELYSHYKNCSKIVDVLVRLKPDLAAVHANTLKSRINRVVEIKTKLVSKKKVKGVTSVEDLKSQVFENTTSGKKLYVTPCKNVQNNCADKSPNLDELVLLSPRQIETERSRSEIAIETPLSQDNISHNKEIPSPEKVESHHSKSVKKALNLFDYEIQKKHKSLQRVLHEVETANEQIKTLQNRIGHNAVRNINKRDETAKKNLHLLRDAQRQLLRQKKQSENENEIIAHLNEQVDSLKLNSNIEIDQHQQNKVSAQKSASYYKVKASNLREKLKTNNDESMKELKSQLTEKDAKIRELESNMLVLQDQINESKIETRTKDGTCTDNVRLCVIELSGLEVAVEKVPTVLRTVSKHLHGTDLSLSDFPSSTTVQSIIDEGHFLAKTLISEKLSEAENWGLNRDGTTRRKQKILDTSWAVVATNSKMRYCIFTAWLTCSSVFIDIFVRICKTSRKVYPTPSKVHLDVTNSLYFSTGKQRELSLKEYY